MALYLYSKNSLCKLEYVWRLPHDPVGAQCRHRKKRVELQQDDEVGLYPTQLDVNAARLPEACREPLTHIASLPLPWERKSQKFSYIFFQFYQECLHLVFLAPLCLLPRQKFQ